MPEWGLTTETSRIRIEMNVTTGTQTFRAEASEERAGETSVSARTEIPHLPISRRTEDRGTGEPNGSLAFRLFRTEELVPPEWRTKDEANGEPAQYRVFNPNHRRHAGRLRNGLPGRRQLQGDEKTRFLPSYKTFRCRAGFRHAAFRSDLICRRIPAWRARADLARGSQVRHPGRADLPDVERRLQQAGEPPVHLADTEEIRELAERTPPYSRGYRIVPHYKDDLLMRRKYWKHLNHFVSVDASPAEFIASIFGAERVISSSLHGIIFAEALGIPACWLAPIGGEDDLKYYDYYFGTQRWTVKRFELLEDALRAEPMPLPNFRQDAYLATFPHEEVAELGAQGIRLNEKVSLGSLAEEEIADYVELWNFELPGKHGIWATGNRSRLQTHVSGCEGLSTVQVEVVLRPFNPHAFKEPQSVEVIANLATRACIEWPRGAQEQMRVKLRVPHNGGSRCLVDLLMIARNARSPRSLGLAPLGQPLAFCLVSIMASEPKHILTKEEMKATLEGPIRR